jgi:hypothetical protein
VLEDTAVAHRDYDIAVGVAGKQAFGNTSASLPPVLERLGALDARKLPRLFQLAVNLRVTGYGLVPSEPR